MAATPIAGSAKPASRRARSFPSAGDVSTIPAPRSRSSAASAIPSSLIQAAQPIVTPMANPDLRGGCRRPSRSAADATATKARGISARPSASESQKRGDRAAKGELLKEYFRKTAQLRRRLRRSAPPGRSGHPFCSSSSGWRPARFSILEYLAAHPQPVKKPSARNACSPIGSPSATSVTVSYPRRVWAVSHPKPNARHREGAP